ncbi:transposable element Tcb2 transposase [Trichonephila clavipes]|nr:transposable element Tcb2 transposase [Trichonephila clavipes]
MVWCAIVYNTQSPLVLIRGTMTAQRYVHYMLQPHVLPLMQRLPGAIFQQDNARHHTARVSQECRKSVTRVSPHCYYPSMACLIPRFLYRTCIPQCLIVSHQVFALEGVQQGIKASVLLPFSLK